jgi:hypothetical protein
MAELLLDTWLVWDPCRLKEIEEAKQLFLKYKRAGHKFQTRAGQQIDKFNPNLGEILVKAERILKHVMKILCDKGDERLTWDKENGREAKEAKKKFTELLAKGYIAYSVDENANKKRKILEFDIDAEEILLIPPTSAG